MSPTIQIKLFATLAAFSPDNADAYEISAGKTVRQIVQELNVPEAKAKLIFINGVKTDLDTALLGGERLGIFPPVGGG